MSQAYFDRSHLTAFGTIEQGSKELADKFFGYYGAVFAAGALSVREKGLVALAVAHTVQCPYCIEAWTSGSLEAGSDLEQMTEAVHVAAAVRGGSVLSYGTQMLGLVAKTGMGAEKAPPVTEAYFSRLQNTARDQIAVGQERLAAAFFAWEQATLAEGALSRAEKSLVGLGVAHTIQDPYAIETFTKSCLDAGCTLEQMTEAIHAACAIRGGAALVHGIQMLEQTKRVAM